MKEGTKVEYTGDTIGDNTSLTIPEYVGKKGITSYSPMLGYWWIHFPDNLVVLACETELKEIP